ncbi:GumC family protein [Iningainema tapete]|uniref:Polysaccharide biosynthesis tyrosine autokinase n=1 Tax=Iningainema tapete BLCC-T55 TaxID=2748662 RepID=A0A8J6XKA6_9CYAN|nr:polysaccharide biosynthesis tyrosine autokinase [Iningainema tapete]MBD2772401.1 polysaccharide biosynthesis tyrosine autokinase [Iningainema tapete BLCC-T55]
METSSVKNSSTNGHRAYVIPPVVTHSSPWLPDRDEDWDLRQLLNVAKRRVFAIAGVMTLVMVGVVGVMLNQKPVYEAKFQILAEPVNSDNNKTKINLGDQNINKSSLDYETQIQVLKSPELMTNIIKQLQRSYPELDYNSLVDSLTITRLGETKIIEVSYRSNLSAKTKTVLQKLAQAYLKYSLENRQTNLRQGIQFVEQQLPFLHNRVNQLQEQQQIFRQKYNFTDPTTQAQQLDTQVKLVSEQRLGINQQIAKAQANYVNLQKSEGAQAILDKTPVYQQLITQLRQLEIQISSELTRFHEESIPVQNLLEKRQRLLPLIRNEAQRVWNIKLAESTNEIQTLQYQSQELGQTEKKIHQRVEQLPVLIRQYTELQRNIQIATESLNRFLITRETLQVELAQTEIPWQLVQATTEPFNALSPNIPRNLVVGFFVSTVLGMIMALLIEKLDDTYHSIEALREKLKLPLLATIPVSKELLRAKKRRAKEKSSPEQLAQVPQDSSTAVVVTPPQSEQSQNSYQSSRFLEAFRLLHTNIQLLSSDQQIRSIVISSASPADGKSTIAFHLAQTAAAMGQRVLLVDADLRQPRISYLSNLNNLWGLSSVLTGGMPVETVIRQIPSYGEFSIITAGPIPPDPTKLLSSQKMKQLMTDFRSNFDLVIYDAPPLVGLADANLLAPNTDGIVLVAKMHKTDRGAITQAMDGLKMTQSHILGAVINGHNQNFLGYYNYY